MENDTSIINAAINVVIETKKKKKQSSRETATMKRSELQLPILQSNRAVDKVLEAAKEEMEEINGDVHTTDKFKVLRLLSLKKKVEAEIRELKYDKRRRAEYHSALFKVQLIKTNIYWLVENFGICE